MPDSITTVFNNITWNKSDIISSEHDVRKYVTMYLNALNEYKDILKDPSTSIFSSKNFLKYLVVILGVLENKDTTNVIKQRLYICRLATKLLRYVLNYNKFEEVGDLLSHDSMRLKLFSFCSTFFYTTEDVHRIPLIRDCLVTAGISFRKSCPKDMDYLSVLQPLSLQLCETDLIQTKRRGFALLESLVRSMSKAEWRFNGRAEAVLSSIKNSCIINEVKETRMTEYAYKIIFNLLNVVESCNQDRWWHTLISLLLQDIKTETHYERKFVLCRLLHYYCSQHPSEGAKAFLQHSKEFQKALESVLMCARAPKFGSREGK